MKYDIKKAILYNLNKNMNQEQYLREFRVAAENLGIAGNKNDEVMLQSSADNDVQETQKKMLNNKFF